MKNLLQRQKSETMKYLIFFLVAHDMIRLVADKWFMAGPSRIAYTDTRKILEH